MGSSPIGKKGKREDRFKGETELRLLHSGAAVALYMEWSIAAPRFAGQPFTLDWARVAARRGGGRWTAKMPEAIRDLIKAKVLDADLRPLPRTEAWVRGWHLAKVRHPAIRPRVGDVGLRRGRTRKVLEVTFTGVSVEETVTGSKRKPRTHEITFDRWRRWARWAVFEGVPGTAERKPRRSR